ncbi:MAG: insulinase family protein [Desulfovibrio sp.]|jgi:Zn-dependent M16 (insulinase) family peptidase|nr:insulinase family protein [Desulfovibrio sp.]
MHGFMLLREENVAELSSTARLWRHYATQAPLLSFINKDENKVFGVTFRTPPFDSSGVAHILEHSVLCGSRNYPVKEPFVELLKGSLHTFLNAFTYPDKTCYPVASANLQDFYNLTDVYLDAVFFPVIGEQTFEQEGRHLEPAEDGLIFKGVVYNEMKGAFSSPESVLERYTLHSLFPDTAYALEAGGDPAHIPDLDYARFRGFHERCYHPSNARFFFWGDDPEEERLRRVAAVLAPFGFLAPDSAVGLQTPFAAPRRVVVPFAVSPAGGEEAEKGMVTLNWMGPETADTELSPALCMLEHILLGLPASPLRRALIESGLGEDLAGGGLEDELRQTVFSVGLKGVERSAAGRVEALILSTLRDLAERGLPAAAVEAAVNSVEFDLRENNSGRFPVGLSVMLRALVTWLHDGDPLAPLRFEGPLRSIKERVAASGGRGYFEELIDKFLLSNPHRVTVILEPDPGLGERLEREEKARIAAVTAGMSAEERAAVAPRAAALHAAQAAPDSPEDLARIPRLVPADLPRRNAPIPTEKLTLPPADDGVSRLRAVQPEEKRGESGHAVDKDVSRLRTVRSDGESRENDRPRVFSEAFFHSLPTRGIVYAEAAFAAAGVPRRLLPLLPLFGRALVEMGTRRRDFVEFGMRVACKTGGMAGDLLFFTRFTDRTPHVRMILAGKAAPDRTADLFDLMGEALCEAAFTDPERFLRMVLEEKARLEHNLAPAGHLAVASRLRASLCAAGRLEEEACGLSALPYLRRTAKTLEAGDASVLGDLETLRRAVLRGGVAELNITALPEQRAELEKQAADLAGRLAAADGRDYGADPAGTPDESAADRRARARRDAAARASENRQENRPENTFLENTPENAPVRVPDASLPEREALLMPVQVNYTGKGVNLFDAGYVYGGSAQVVLKHLRAGYLWDRVRVQGGAYGCLCALERASGALVAVSYRDPNILPTLDVFDAAAQYLAESPPSRAELEKAVIGAIGELDVYLLPDAKGRTAFARALGADDEERRGRMREEILSTTRKDFTDFAAALEALKNRGRVCVLGGPALERTAAEQGWTVLKVL